MPVVTYNNILDFTQTPAVDNTYDLGSTSLRWGNVYAFAGRFYGSGAAALTIDNGLTVGNITSGGGGTTASAGFLRLQNATALNWENAAGNGYLTATFDASNNFALGSSNANGSVGTIRMNPSTTKTVDLTFTNPAVSRVYTVPDAGAAANVVLDQGSYTIAGTWTFSAAITASAGITSAGALTITGAGASSWTLSSGALTIGTTSAANLILEYNSSAVLTFTSTTSITIATGTTVTGTVTFASAITFSAAGTAITVTNTVQAGVFQSGTANPAGTGVVRLANNEGINFRNAANSADLNLISSNASNQPVVGAGAGGSILFNNRADMNSGFQVNNGFNVNSSGLTTRYNGIATAGLGLVAVYGIDNRKGITAADGATTTLYTTITATGLFRITVDIFATAYTSGTATYTATWTENSQPKVLVVTATVVNTLGTGTDLINPDNGTVITVQLTGVFVATVNVAAVLEQLVA